MECVVFIGVALYCDDFVPIVEPQFLEGGETLEYSSGVLYWFALLPDQLVEFLSFYLSL